MKKPNKKVTDKIKDVFHGKTGYVSAQRYLVVNIC
jgi:hypothetical protein